ncbi:hypothetical protein LGN35_24155 [Burkholderia multivorans]|nr:hypothetical protein [Burkholderia multivorans]
MDEREMFEATLVELTKRDEETFDKPFPNDDINVLWAIWKEARRTTPDRDAIIEECAKVCEMERDALRKNEAVWDANPNLRPDEDYVSEWEASACRGEEYAAAIRALKTAPTSDQGEKS